MCGNVRDEIERKTCRQLLEAGLNMKGTAKAHAPIAVTPSITMLFDGIPANGGLVTIHLLLL